MCLLILDDRVDSMEGIRITVPKVAQLCLEVSQHHSFYRDCGGTNGWASAQAGNESQEQTTGAAEVITAAATETAAPQFCSEDGSMPLFVTLEFFELPTKFCAAPATSRSLGPIDVHRTVFTGVVHLEDSSAERFADVEARGGFHRASNYF
jgi:hypothetical protein